MTKGTKVTWAESAVNPIDNAIGITIADEVDGFILVAAGPAPKVLKEVFWIDVTKLLVIP